MKILLFSKLSDAANPGTSSVWVAAPVALLVLVLVLRALIPQAVGLWWAWRDLREGRGNRRRHRDFLEFQGRKNREDDPRGEN